MHTIIIDNKLFTFTRFELENVLTAVARDMYFHMHKQGGRIRFGLGSVAPQYRETIKNKAC